MKQAGISYQIFDQIEENPSVESVGKAAEAGKKFNSDFVIGIGGGSPLDAAKAVALLIADRVFLWYQYNIPARNCQGSAAPPDSAY